jgi:5-methylcytosine-specific restriction endonuclease McrA
MTKNKDQVYRELSKANLPQRCSSCGAEKGLIVHHLDGNHANNALENLEVLCRSCHARVSKPARGPRKLERRVKLLPQRFKRRV